MFLYVWAHIPFMALNGLWTLRISFDIILSKRKYTVNCNKNYTDNI